MQNSLLVARMVLNADTAADLMTPNPISLRSDAALTEVITFLLDHAFSAAPVIDEAGRAVGVLSLSDILVHHRRQLEFLAAGSARFPTGEPIDLTFTNCPASEIMTPLTYTVSVDTPASRVVEEMLGMRVHHLYVVDDDGTLVGTISVGDVLRRLRPEGPTS